MKRILRVVVILGLCFAAFAASAQVSFENVTSELGPFHVGESWGAAWGDINNDYYPDIGAGNHRHRQSMWINLGGTGFRDGILQFDRQWTFLSEPGQDTHGVTFTDIDNDGDQDFVGARSSSGGRAQVFLNDQGIGYEQAVQMGITGFVGAGRLGVTYDYNRDGLLDFLYASSSRVHNRVFVNQGNNTFSDVTQASFYASSACGGLNYYQFSAIDNDTSGVPNFEISCMDEGHFPKALYDTSSGSNVFTNITDTLPTSSNTIDTVFGDFDNDGDNDIIAIRGALRGSSASLVSPTQIEAWMTSSSSAGAKSFTFESSDSITIESLDISRDSTPIDQFRIGGADNMITTLPLTLDKNSAFAQGISTNTGKGVYIGYDTATSKWTVRITSTDFEDYYLALSGNGLTEPADFVLASRDEAFKPIYFENTDSGFNRIYNIGVDEVFCNSIAAGDFDNDMDLDIYLACGSGIENIKNRLYLNDGSGSFDEVLAHGAEGIIGAGVEQSAGVAESVIMADYDIDGRLDLFTTNGMLYQPSFIGGPDELFRNTTDNSNNWIELDLIGVADNRDAMGATVTATAGGVDQIREQNNGYHRWSQNHKRIHFGLGSNATANISVRWPDGTVDTYANVTANSLYEVVQGGAMQAIVPSGFVDYPAPVSGQECSSRGQAYLPEEDRGVFLSKDCTTGLWSLRAVSGDSAETVNFSGYILAGQSISSVSPFDMEGADFANLDGRRIDFSLNMSGMGEDGFDFDLGANTTACLLLENEDNIVVGEYHLLAPNKLDLIQMGACAQNPDGSLDVPELTSVSLESDILVIPGSGGNATHLIDLSSLGVSIGDTVSVSQLAANGDLNNNVGIEFFSLDFNNGEYSLAQLETGFDCSGNLEPTLTNLNQTLTVTDIGGGVPGLIISGETTSGVGSSCIDVEFQLTITASSIVTVDPSLAACGAPSYSTSEDAGLYVWKDCGASENWFVRANAGGGGATTYEGEFLAGNPISTVSPYSFEGVDNYQLSMSDTFMSFLMRMARSGEDGLEFALSNQSDLCLSLSDPAQTIFVGAEKVAFNSSVNLDDFSVACITSTPPEPEPLACGEPTSFIPADNAGLFLWKDCGGDDTWQLIGTAGGGSAVTYTGSLSSTSSISLLQLISFEGVDTASLSNSDQQLDFLIRMANKGQDGIQFDVGADGACFNVDLPAGLDVIVGEDNNVLTPPFNIETLDPC
ncbi:CRTAC1 family protein [Arenicella sp.]|nr:CRTAC1 family protein [Arenicella sp.]